MIKNIEIVSFKAVFRKIFAKMALKNTKSRVYRKGENYNTALADVIE